MKKIAIITGTILSVLVFTEFPGHGDQNIIYGCYQKNNGQLRIVKNQNECKPSEVPISWNQVAQEVGEPDTRAIMRAFALSANHEWVSAVERTPQQIATQAEQLRLGTSEVSVTCDPPGDSGCVVCCGNIICCASCPGSGSTTCCGPTGICTDYPKPAQIIQ